MMTRKSPEEIEKVIEDIARRAVESGVQKALKDIGLHDEEARRDIRDIRNLLDAWRKTKRTAWNTTVRWATTGLLGYLIFTLGVDIGKE